jgi:hypothetical protein
MPLVFSAGEFFFHPDLQLQQQVVSVDQWSRRRRRCRQQNAAWVKKGRKEIGSVTLT